MKKYFMILVAALMVACVSSCSKSDDDSSESKNYLLGEWKGEDALYSSFEGGTWYKVMNFKSDGTYENYYEKSDGTIKMKTVDNKYVITSDSTFTTYNGETNAKMGYYVCYKTNFKPKDWNKSTTVYYITFWKQ